MMTEEQILVLQKQISVYGTLSQQLADMHAAHHSSAPGASLYACDPMITTPKKRWTPTQKQLAILERIFAEAEGHGGTPTKQRIIHITAELSQHGNISEASVYNWFQNRRARCRRPRRFSHQSSSSSSSSLPITTCNAPPPPPSDCSCNAQPEPAEAATMDDWMHTYLFDTMQHQSIINNE